MKIKSIFIKEFHANVDGINTIKEMIYRKYLLGKEEFYLYDKNGKLLRYKLLKDSYINRFIDFILKR